MELLPKQLHAHATRTPTLRLPLRRGCDVEQMALAVTTPRSHLTMLSQVRPSDSTVPYPLTRRVPRLRAWEV
jgi:hypothetical protein